MMPIEQGEILVRTEDILTQYASGLHITLHKWNYIRRESCILVDTYSFFSFFVSNFYTSLPANPSRFTLKVLGEEQKIGSYSLCDCLQYFYTHAS
jgi:hypothetical protein